MATITLLTNILPPKLYSQWERVGYVQLPQAVGYIVLTSRDQASYQKDSDVLEKVLKTLVYLEPKSEVASGQEYARRYRQLVDQHADGQIEPLLTEWREKAPDDPDAWITSANYYFNQRQTNISTKKPGPDDITLTDKKGKLTGSISFEQTNENMKRAADLLVEATTKFPDHLDIWCGLAFMYQENGDFDNELAVLKKMVAYARAHPAQLKWLKGEPLGKPADKFVAEKLHEYGSYYEEKEDAEDDKRWHEISTLATAQYPNDPQGFKDAAGYWADVGEWQKARESFEKAHQLDPKSAAALVALGQISAEMEDFPSARKVRRRRSTTGAERPTLTDSKGSVTKTKEQIADMRKAHLLICSVLLLFRAPSFAQENSGNGSAKQDAPKVIATDDMKLAMKAGKLESAGKYDEALRVYAQAIDLKGRFTPFVYHNRGMLYLHRAKASKIDNRELPTCNTRSMTSRLPFVSAQLPRKN